MSQCCNGPRSDDDAFDLFGKTTGFLQTKEQSKAREAMPTSATRANLIQFEGGRVYHSIFGAITVF